MDKIRPATWLVEHLTPQLHNESLAGDLLQEYRSGRSARWYWRQVLVAILIGWWEEICLHPFRLLFVLFWSAVAPACDFWVQRIVRTPSLAEWLWKLTFPWSLLCAGAIDLALSLAFVWAGVLAFLLVQMEMGGRTIERRRVKRGVISSALVFVVSNVLMSLTPPISHHALDKLGIVAAISPDRPRDPFADEGIYDMGPSERAVNGPKYVPLQSHVWRFQQLPDDRQSKPPAPRTAFDWVRDADVSADIARLPYFLSLLFALWHASAGRTRRVPRGQPKR